MKRLFLSIAIIACMSLTATVGAQESRRGGREVAKELNLTADQQQKMEAAKADMDAKMKELRDNKSLSKEDRMAKMKELREQHQAACNNILTPEQQAKAKELKAKRGERMKDGRKGKGRDGKSTAMRPYRGQMDKGILAQHGNRMKDLNLTDDQKQKIKALNDEYRTKTKELSQKHRDDLNKIYTPEQQAKLKDMRKRPARDGKFAFNGKRGSFNLDEASKAKLKSLKEDFIKQKQAVELSRIAPDAQKQKISELRENYKKERRQIMTDACKAKENQPV
ncbi:Spy/CpxP family protein refolding chaperone [Dysgonomonas sp. PFB1-18]|uniref:hypothetical protein n=1 Tax=unclassified Dysgonomonas TaxID=2630389 RepID=UPI002476C5C2|nr:MULTISPECIES: hypothetical protein [unclassified Dysgonomonas]MDH6308696.1 Spy/CpxP family protein refolding chaperone [Dysgonomonas sp. PF1-14]MDH6338607.1 Spy/CpxP family protein refolding chaperone [Dysgonomonas sp. PF1-16]MDH6379945.1 Spy/CpxP family protein refolding chaperone [Dysgonomonas sp. PFB1-18]MDH6397435.1 Spy/CpxP family protein refolding chaperone [Dysgonomonas sp. PF1-23]